MFRSLLILLLLAPQTRVNALYDNSTATITCHVPHHDTNRHLNISVRGYNIRTSRTDQSVGHVLTGLPNDPILFTYQIPGLDCEGDLALDAVCELFTSERPAVLREAHAVIPCDAPPAPYQRPSV